MSPTTVLASVVRELLAPRDRTSWTTLEGFVAALDDGGATGSTVETALRGGASADRLGYAFVAGYRAALAALVPSVGERACLAATEHGGAHPRAIHTTLAEQDGALVLTGEKTFTTLASVADTLLVVARCGERPDGRPLLRIVRVPVSRDGVRVVDRAPTPFAPEVPHARVTFAHVRVAPDEVLPGDGYADFLKPFRTVEDLHVHAAAVGFLLATAARIGAAPVAAPTLATAVAALLELARADPRDAAMHVALAGIAPLLRVAIAALDAPWLAADPEGHARFVRDLPLLSVAEAARTERLAVALRGL